MNILNFFTTNFWSIFLVLCLILVIFRHFCLFLAKMFKIWNFFQFFKNFSKNFYFLFFEDFRKFFKNFQNFDFLKIFQKFSKFRFFRIFSKNTIWPKIIKNLKKWFFSKIFKIVLKHISGVIFAQFFEFLVNFYPYSLQKVLAPQKVMPDSQNGV